MDRRTFLGTLTGGFLAAPLAAGAQQERGAKRVGVLSAPEPFTSLDAIRSGLRELGWTEGVNLVLQYRSSEGDDERFVSLATDLVRLNVDVIIAATVPAIRAAQRATTSIPIVMVLNSDPLRLGLVKSLGRPGGNTTGPAALTFDLVPKRLELFKETIPTLRQIAVLSNPTNPAVREGVTQTEVAGRTLRLGVRSFEVREAALLDTALGAILEARPDGLLVLSDPLIGSHTEHIADFTKKHRLPSMWGVSQAVRVGGLIAYGIDYVEHVRASLRYVDKILKGAKPGDLPVEQPTKFELVINLKTAKALGLTIPPSLLQRADQVIE